MEIPNIYKQIHIHNLMMMEVDFVVLVLECVCVSLLALDRHALVINIFMEIGIDKDDTTMRGSRAVRRVCVCVCVYNSLVASEIEHSYIYIVVVCIAPD